MSKGSEGEKRRMARIQYDFCLHDNTACKTLGSRTMNSVLYER